MIPAQKTENPSDSASSANWFAIGCSGAPSACRFRLRFSADLQQPSFNDTTFCLSLPARASSTDEPFAFLVPAVAARYQGPFRFWRDNNSIAGVAIVPVDADSLEQRSREVYRALLEACSGFELYRVWNWIPDINRNAPQQNEFYRLFCAGRARAFNEVFPSSSEAQMPAASGVGICGNHLVVYFCGGSTAVEHRENPRQMPAYRYPKTYGPKPPSFARASIIQSRDSWHFISGTASIIHSETQCIGDLQGQLQVTIENLKIVGSDCSGNRFFRVYLRHWQDLETIRSVLQRDLLCEGDEVSYVEADLCRTDLLVEIEACFRSPAFAGKV